MTPLLGGKEVKSPKQSQLIAWKGLSHCWLLCCQEQFGHSVISHPVVSDSLWPLWIPTCQASLSFTISWNLLNFMSTELVMPSNHLILCHPLLLLASIFPSIRIFSNESALRIRWPECWSLSFSIGPSNKYAELIFFRMDWFDLLGHSVVIKIKTVDSYFWGKLEISSLNSWLSKILFTQMKLICNCLKLVLLPEAKNVDFKTGLSFKERVRECCQAWWECHPHPT